MESLDDCFRTFLLDSLSLVVIWGRDWVDRSVNTKEH